MTKRGKRLVIDTDVVRSAGGENATEIRSTNCRDVLKAILSASQILNSIQIGDKKKQERLCLCNRYITSFVEYLEHRNTA